jgi:hypothetical protein
MIAESVGIMKKQRLAMKPIIVSIRVSLQECQKDSTLTVNVSKTQLCQETKILYASSAETLRLLLLLIQQRTE